MKRNWHALIAVIAIGVISAALILALRPDVCRSLVIDGQGTHSTPEEVITSVSQASSREFTRQVSPQGGFVFERRGHRYLVGMGSNGLWMLDSVMC